MRTIKFRGKRLDNGQWIYGYLTLISGVTGYIRDLTSKKYSVKMVDINTLGQFTGLKDSKGKEIYEDDIILYGGTIQHEVVFRHGAFGYLLYGREFISYAGNTNFTFNPLDHSKEHKVIGNIHDNPELLKGSKDGED